MTDREYAQSRIDRSMIHTSQAYTELMNAQGMLEIKELTSVQRNSILDTLELIRIRAESIIEQLKTH